MADNRKGAIMKAVLQVNPKYIRSLRHLMAANGEIRYYLKGVQVIADEKRGKFYTATNGHVLGVYHEPWRDGETPCSAEFIIPGDVVKAIKPRKRLDQAVLERVGEQWKFSALDGADLQFTPIDGKYPDVRRVIPTKPSGELAHFNYDYLADFNRVGRDGWGMKYSVSVFPNGLSAALVKNGCADFVGAIMPLRVADDETLPDWLS